MPRFVNSLHLADYVAIAAEVAGMQSIITLLRKYEVPVEVSYTHVVQGHQESHRLWEYSSALHLIPDRHARILDVGSGNSPLGAAFSCLYNAEVTECEPDVGVRTKLDEFLIKNKYRPIRHLQQGLDNLPDELFDMVTCISVMEHVDPELEKIAWLELAKRVRVGGVLFVTVDCVPEEKPYGSYKNDEYRRTNFTPAMLAERFATVIKSGFAPVGETDWIYHGDHVFDYTFFRLGFKRVH